MSEDKKILILLNDKDPVLTRVMKMKYKHDAGWESIISNDIDTALETFQKEKPDAVVTEIILKDNDGRSGFDFIESLQNIDIGKKAIVSILTELSQEEDKKKANELGVEHYYVKSQISIKDFIEEMKKIIAN